MAQGRCAGCGKTGASCKAMDQHIVSCPQYVQLTKTNPLAALDPRQEYERWNKEENSTEARAERKEERLGKKFAELDVKREAQQTRWATPPDPLAD